MVLYPLPLRMYRSRHRFRLGIHALSVFRPQNPEFAQPYRHAIYAEKSDDNCDNLENPAGEKPKDENDNLTKETRKTTSGGARRQEHIDERIDGVENDEADKNEPDNMNERVGMRVKYASHFCCCLLLVCHVNSITKLEQPVMHFSETQTFRRKVCSGARP